MSEAPASLTIRTYASLTDIPATAWNACARPETPTPSCEVNPSLSHQFLTALEQSGTVSPGTGWAPHHLAVEQGKEIIAVAPAYIKSHSMGEYVFDHSWADAYERAGGRYYPKLQLAVPFTPIPGGRFLVKEGPHSGAAQDVLMASIAALVERSNLSSAHATFLSQAECERASQHGFLQRQDQQFHWHNHGYLAFDDFLDALTSRKRKAIRRERREALEPAITIERVTGSDIAEAHWDAFFSFYMNTSARKWGRPYLNRLFFSLIGEQMSDQILLVMARRDGRYIAGALNLIGSHALYGRNWGALEHHPFLHFELCYYQAIDFAIERGLARVEAGAQGEHKLARGYLPSPTYSAHYIASASFRRAVAAYLERERSAVDDMIETLTELGPFRRGAAEIDS